MKYQRKIVPEVEAMQFDGTEESAAAVIAWADALDGGPDIVRHLEQGSWNDQHPELWLKVKDYGLSTYASPGHWIVVEKGDSEIVGDAAFREEYAPM